MQLIEIRELVDRSAALVGLNKYNRSKIPNTAHVVYARQGTDGRYITGIDDRSVTLQKIQDPAMREKEMKRRKELRERLEKLLNVNLEATSLYWETFKIDLSTTKLLTLGNPRDDLKYEFLVANEYVAPDEASASSPVYSNCKFYIYRKEVSDSEKVSKQRSIDLAKAEWLKIADNNARARIYASYCLGNKFSPDYSADTRYGMMSDWLSELANAGKFLDILKLKPEELQVKILVDFALNKNVIRVREGYYQRGNATYGRSPEETVRHLQNSEHANEFESLRQELLKDYQYKL